MNANGRLCRKFKARFGHLARLGGNRCSARSIYPPTSTDSVASAIAREKETARRMAAAKGKKKAK